MKTKMRPMVLAALRTDAPLSRSLFEFAATLVPDNLVPADDLYRRPECPADVATAVRDHSLRLPDGTARAMSDDEAASWLLRPEQRPQDLTSADVALWAEGLVQAVADRACRVPSGAATLPDSLIDILINHPRLDVRAMMLRRLGDTPRARQVVQDIGRAAADLSMGFTTPATGPRAVEIVEAVNIVTGWTVSRPVQKHALAVWDAPWAVGTCSLYDAGPELAERFATVFLVPALAAGAQDPVVRATDTARLLEQGVSHAVAASLAAYWTPEMIEDIDNHDGELAELLIDGFVAHSLVFPGPGAAPVDDSLTSDFLRKKLEELAVDYPDTWTLASTLLEGGFTGTNDALVAAVIAASD